MAGQSREETQPSGPDSRFADALRPLIESALKRSVRNDPEFWARTIAPILGPAIRIAVSSAIRDMVEKLDQLLENGLSARSWQWRAEAWRTGRPFAEVVLLRTLIYRVEQVLLVDRNSGLPIASVSAPGIVARDTSLVSAMLTAIQEFIHDSFNLEQDDSIRQIHTGDFSLWVESGPSAAIAAAVRGNAPMEFRHILRAAIDLIHEEMGTTLRDFQGDAKAIERQARPILERCLQSRFQERKPASHWRIGVGASLAGLALLLWGGIKIWRVEQWNEALAALRATPGIAITRSAREHGKRVLEGLRDPFAPPPESVLAKKGIPPRDVSMRFEPFFSLHPNLLVRRARAAINAPDSISTSVHQGVLRLGGAAPHQWVMGLRNKSPKLAVAGIAEVRMDEIVDRDLQDLRSEIEQARVLFDTGSSAIGRSQARLIADLVPKLRRWIDGAREIGRTPAVSVIGHADQTGGDLGNTNLSHQRAHRVREFLLDAGVPADPVAARAEQGLEDLGGGEPVDSPLRRNVVFRLSLSSPTAEGGRP